MSSYTPQSVATYLQQIRDLLDGLVGPLEYDGTIDGAWSYVGANIASQIDQQVFEAINNVLLATATAQAVVARALDVGLTPRPATASTMGVRMLSGAGGVVPVGTVLRVTSGTVTIADEDLGVSITQDPSRWVVTENLQDLDLVNVGEDITIEAQETGQVVPQGVVVLSPEPPIAGVDSFEWNTAYSLDRTTGRAAETPAELRQRVKSQRAVVGGSLPGLNAAVLELAWVVAVGITTAPGQITVAVAPAPPTTADETDLAQTLYENKAAGDITQGAQSVNITGVDGQTVTINYDVGSTQDVTVVLTITPAPGVSQADADVAARNAVREVFAALQPGETLYYLRVVGSLDLDSIVGATVTLDGGTSDITPASAADVLVEVFA